MFRLFSLPNAFFCGKYCKNFVNIFLRIEFIAKIYYNIRIQERNEGADLCPNDPMNEQQFKRYKIYAYGTGVLAPLAALFVTLFYGKYYDIRVVLFDRGTPVILLWIGLFAVTLFALSALFTLKSDALPFLYPKKCSLFTLFASSFSGASLLSALLFFVLAKDGDKMAQIYYSGIPEMANASKMLGICLVFALFGAGYFFTAAFLSKPVPLLGITLELWLFSYLLLIYYDMSELVMDPVRTLTVLSLCSTVLFVLCELRYLYGRSAPRAFVICSSLAAIIPFASGFYKIFLVFSGEALFDTAFVLHVAETGIALYALSRLLSFAERSAFEVVDGETEDNGYAEISEELGDDRQTTPNEAETAEEAETVEEAGELDEPGLGQTVEQESSAADGSVPCGTDEGSPEEEQS